VRIYLGGKTGRRVADIPFSSGGRCAVGLAILIINMAGIFLFGGDAVASGHKINFGCSAEALI
jgi:hypothetical protein